MYRHRSAVPPIPRHDAPAALLSAVALGVALALSGHAHAVEPADTQVVQQQVMDFDIAAQPLDRAALAFAEQAGVQVFFDSARLQGLDAPAVKGRYTIDEGMRQLLRGAPVSYRFSGVRQITLSRQVATDAAAIELHDITVTAAHVNDWVYQEPRSVSVITREDIDKRPPRHVADMLADTPGVTSAVNRHNPGLSVNIRGMQDFGRVNMMIDGMRQNHVESGHQQRNGEVYIDSELLSSVVIEKGPNAGVYGANAIAGSANFQTLDYDDIILPGQDQGVRLRGSTGIGGDANGMHFLGSVAVAGRFDERLELLFARSQKNLGEYDIGNRGRSISASDTTEEMNYSDQKQDSWLAKARLTLSDDQSLQFTYTETEISYNNTSTSAYIGDGYSKYGNAEAGSKSYALDYAFSPDNPLIDLKTKVYFVSTQNERINNPAPNAMTDTYWDNDICLGNNLDSFAQDTCLAGMRKTSTSRTDTWGLQLENTSRFQVSAIKGAEFSANYGVEWFQDEGKSGNKSDRHGVTTPFLADQTGNNLNPSGRRDVVSAFSSLTFKRDPVTLKAGLRYDWYHIRGKTTVPGTQDQYKDRFASYLNYFNCSRSNQNVAACAAAQSGGVNGAVQFLLSGRRPVDYWTDVRFAPYWTSEKYRYEYDVDRRQGKLSPFFSAAYQPLDWLELFGNWGKGFRPPAMTETLWEGSHGSGSSAWMYPNPLLDSERTTSWEVGFNILQRHLFKADDRLATKMAYFDTKADSYMFASINNTLPGEIPGLGLGNTFFQNNLIKTRFKGVELEANYDGGFWYSSFNYTKYLSGENNFCTKVFPVGSHSSRWDQPNEDGSMTAPHLQAIAEGYGSYREKMDAMSYCGADVVLNSVVARPMDKHGVTTGIRLFQRELDIGIRYNRSEGYTPDNDLAGRELWDSYTTWDLYAAYQPRDNITLNFVVENIRDENYLSDYSDMFSRTYAPGRTVQAGMEIRF